MSGYYQQQQQQQQQQQRGRRGKQRQSAVDPMQLSQSQQSLYTNEFACSKRPWQKSVTYFCQKISYQYGVAVTRQWKLFLLLTLVAFCLCTLGLKDAKFDTDFTQFWMSDEGRSAKAQDAQLLRNYPSLMSSSMQLLMQLLMQRPSQQLQQPPELPDSEPAPHTESVLTKRQLLAHMRLLERIVGTEVRVFNLPVQSISMEQLCLKYDFGQLDIPDHVRGFMEALLPCRIVTPLDCFWEGAKLLGPRVPVRLPGLGVLGGFLPESASASLKDLDRTYRWTNLDPQAVLRAYSEAMNIDSFPRKRASPVSGQPHHSMRRLAEALSSVGLKHGYTRRPCLDPSDPQCPRAGRSSSNRSVLDTLSPGCAGFAERLISWPAEKLIGGAVRDPDTGRLTGGRALLSAVVLKSPAHLLQDYRRNQPLSDWSLDKTKRLLDSWWEHFDKLVAEENSRHGEPIFLAFNEQHSVNDALGQATRTVHWTKWSLLIAGCCAYVMAVLFDSHSLLHSQLTVACLALPLLLLSVTGGLGLACWCRVPLDLLSVQVLPFVQLGIGAFYCLIMANCYNHLYQTSEPGKHHAVIPILMQRTAPQTLAFLLVCQAAPAGCLLSPLAAVRLLCRHWAANGLQLALLCVAGLPAVFAADCARRRRLGADLICCRLSRESPSARVSLPRSLGSRLGRCLTSPRRRWLCWLAAVCAGVAAGAACLLGGVGCWRLAETTDYSPVELLPADSQEYRFLANRRTLYADSVLQLRIEKIDYPRQQQLSRQLFRSLAELPFANASGSSPFWLDEFRSWLQRLQARYDEDVRLGAIRPRLCSRQDGLNFTEAASDEGILAAHLLVQTGRFDEFDLLALDADRARLVDRRGVIDPGRFYSCLTSWHSQSGLSYETANSLLLPKPEQYSVQARHAQLQYIPPSKELELTQTLLPLSGLNSTRAYLLAGARIQDVSRRFERLGLDHMVSGPVFDFHSPDWVDAGKMAGLLTALLTAAAVAALAVFCKLLAALLCSALCLANLLQLAAILWAAGIPLNLMTCTGVALAFPLMFFVNLMLVFQASLRPPAPSPPPAVELVMAPSAAVEAADCEGRKSARSGSDVEAAGQQQQPVPKRSPPRPDWPLAALLWSAGLAALPTLAAFAASAFPGSPLLSACLGGPLLAGPAAAVLNAVLVAAAVAPAPSLLPPHPLRPPPTPRPPRRRAGRQSGADSPIAELEDDDDSEDDRDSDCQEVEEDEGFEEARRPPAPRRPSPPSYNASQRSLSTIPEESGGEASPAATPPILGSGAAFQQQQQVVTATLRVYLPQRGPPPRSVRVPASSRFFGAPISHV